MSRHNFDKLAKIEQQVKKIIHKKSRELYCEKNNRVKNMKGKITSSMWRITDPKISMTKISIVSEVDLSHFNGYAN